MDGSVLVEGQVRRGARGRFVPGVSGNPAGKRKGTRNRATVLAEALAADEDGTIARVVIDKAVAGDAVAARFLLGLLVPKPRGRTIELDLPACNSPDDVVAAFDVTVAAMASGEITPDEALTVSRVLDRRRRAIEARARRRGGVAEPAEEADDVVAAMAAGTITPQEALDEGKATAPLDAPGDIGGDAAQVAAPAAPGESRAATTSAPATPDLHLTCKSRESVNLHLPSTSDLARAATTSAPAMRDLHLTCNSRQSAKLDLLSTSNLTQSGTVPWRPRAGGGSGLDRWPAPIIISARA